MKQDMIFFALFIAILVGAVASTWWIRGKQMDAEFTQKLSSAPHKIDTVNTIKYIPVPPEHVEIGPLPAKEKDCTLWGVGEHIMESVLVVDTNGVVLQAYSLSDADSLDRLVRYLAAPVDTVVTSDSSGSVRIRYNPIHRMLIADFQPAPMKEIDTQITDIRSIPVDVHDSFLSRVGVFTAGAACMAIIYSIAR